MPKTKLQSTGICVYCKSEFDKSRMTTHLKHCKQRKTAIAQEKEDEAKLQPSRKSRMLHFLVEGYYQPEYWLHLEVPAWLWLSELDDFLRDIWLECCGHLSEFKIGNIHYASMSEEYSFFGGLGDEQETQDEPEEEEIDDSDEFKEIPKPSPEDEEAEATAWAREKLEMIVTPDMPPERVALIENLLRKNYERISSSDIEEYTMDVKVGKVFKTGIKASYTYDFGSSTHLLIRVLAEREVDVYELDEDGVEENEDDELEEVSEEIVENEDKNEDEGQAGEYDDDVITIMARNIPPVILCDTCGKPATLISTFGGFEALCNACYRKGLVVVGEDGEEVDEEIGEIDDYFGEGVLPVVNSPRMGVCGYTGH